MRHTQDQCEDIQQMKKVIHGDGNTRGIITRQALVEHDLGIVKWASGVAAAGVIIQLIALLFKSVIK